MTSGEQITLQEIHLLEDEASTQGTHDVCFIVKQVEKAQKKPFLKPIIDSLMMVHALRLLTYEPPVQNPPL